MQFGQRKIKNYNEAVAMVKINQEVYITYR